MGVYQRYIKKNKDGDNVIGKNGKPVKEGAWFVQYPYSRDSKTGKLKYTTILGSHSKKKAQKLFRAKTDAFHEFEQFGVSIDSEMIFPEFMDWGLDQEVMKDKASAKDDKARAKHLKNYFKNRIAIQVTPLEVENFMKVMIKTVSLNTGRTFSGATVNKMVSLARRIYYLGIAQGIVKSNPFAKRCVFKEKSVGQYIPDHEFWEIYKNLRAYLKPVILLGYLTGMRRGEILELAWDRVNLKEGYVDLTPDDTKTSESRTIFFNSIEILKDVFIEAAKKHHKDQDLVFTKEGGEAVPKHYIHRLFKKACKEAGVKAYRLHDLRHTFNTNMSKAGVDQAVIMKLTGHKTNAMFLRYSHLDREQGEGAMKKLNGFIEAMENNTECVSGT